MATLLQIVQDAARDVGQPVPSLVASSNEETPRRMLRLLNKAGQQLIKDHDWSVLMDVETFTPTATQIQSSHPPADFDRFTSQTPMWDINNKRPMVGPLSIDKWLRVVVESTQQIDKFWAYINSQVNILPVPATTDSFVYSYQSKNWVLSSAAAPKAAFTADDDTPRLSAELLTLELVWRWKQSIGLDYGEDMATCNRLKETVIAADRGNRVLNLASPTMNAIPDNLWIGTITA